VARSTPSSIQPAILIYSVQRRSVFDRTNRALDSVPDVIIAVNRSGNIRFQSAAATRLLDYEPGELVGRNMFEFVHCDDVQRLYHALFGVIEKFSANAEVDVRLLARDGSWRIQQTRKAEGGTIQ
jgi:PAS domain S-box-containing protein